MVLQILKPIKLTVTKSLNITKRVVIGLIASSYFQIFERGTSKGNLKHTFVKAELDFHLALRRILVASYGSEVPQDNSYFFKRIILSSVVKPLEIYLDRTYRRAAEKILSASPIFPVSVREHKQEVLLLAGTLGPGGTERQLVNTATGLKSRHVSCEVLCTNLDSDVNRFFMPELVDQGINVSAVVKNNWDSKKIDLSASEELKSFFNSTFREFPRDLFQVGDFILELNARKPRVVHTWLDDTNIKGGLAAAIVGVEKIVLCTRSVSPKNFLLFQPYMRSVYRALLAQPNVTLINNSRAGARDYAAWLGIDEKEIEVVYNGYNFDIFNKLPKQQLRRFYRQQFKSSDEEQIVGGIFRLSEEKQPLLWLDVAIAMLQQKSSLKFVIIGDGPLREIMGTKISFLNLSDKILMLGHRSEALQILPSFDLFFLASRKEGLPNVLIESQATGVPVISFDAGGAAETYSPGSTGVLLDANGAHDIATQALALLSDRRWLIKASGDAPDFVETRFASAKMLDDMLENYR